MQINYIVIIAIVTYILGSFTKLKWVTLPNKYIPIQNVVIAIVSAVVCYFTKIETNFLQALVLSFSATMGSGGIYDLVHSFDDKVNKDYDT